MRVYTLFFLVTVCTAYVIKNPVNENSDRYFYFSDDDEDDLQLIDSYEPVDFDFIEQYVNNPNNNNFWLFTRYNPLNAQILKYNESDTILNSNFDVAKTTVFLVHGWRGDNTSDINILLTKAFLQNNDVNVIVFDWNALASKNYITAKRGVPGAGRSLGKFINWLISFGVSYENIHLVGYSLGGHLVGNAGREANGNVQRITALDPARPLWTRDKNRLTNSHGKYVEVIHTNTAFLGYPEPCGHADFYPNGGSTMVGCNTISCSHSRSYEYMASSVQFNHLLAYECGSKSNVIKDKCYGNSELMGNSNLRPKRPGLYRLNTNSSYPYYV